MPRRRRPPMTTREIAAYQAGWRLAAYWLDSGRNSRPTQPWVVERLAQEDGEVLFSIGARKFFRWFDRGWDERMFGGGW